MNVNFNWAFFAMSSAASNSSSCSRLFFIRLIVTVLLVNSYTWTRIDCAQLSSSNSGGSGAVSSVGSSSSSGSVVGASAVAVGVGKKDARCEEISIPMCRGIGYNWTSMPNSLHHGNLIRLITN